MLGPARIGYLLGRHPSTVHNVLSRYGLAQLAWLDRASGRVIRRYEHDAPGDMIRVDIKNFRLIPDGGGHKAAGNRNKIRILSEATPQGPGASHPRPQPPWVIQLAEEKAPIGSQQGAGLVDCCRGPHSE